MAEQHARASNGLSDNESSDRVQTIVITGGTSGIGFAAAAEAILRSDGGPWHVVVANRDPDRAKAAVTRLAAAATLGHTVEAILVGLASLASVRAFAAELTARLDSGVLPALHALVLPSQRHGRAPTPCCPAVRSRTRHTAAPSLPVHREHRRQRARALPLGGDRVAEFDVGQPIALLRAGRDSLADLPYQPPHWPASLN